MPEGEPRVASGTMPRVTPPLAKPETRTVPSGTMRVGALAPMRPPQPTAEFPPEDLAVAVALSRRSSPPAAGLPAAPVAPSPLAPPPSAGLPAAPLAPAPLAPPPLAPRSASPQALHLSPPPRRPSPRGRAVAGPLLVGVVLIALVSAAIAFVVGLRG